MNEARKIPKILISVGPYAQFATREKERFQKCMMRDQIEVALHVGHRPHDLPQIICTPSNQK
jgi:hypothetical protein